MNSYIWMCLDTGCSWEDLPEVIDMDGKKESRNFMLLAWLNDDDDDEGN